jgi:hypothetical protein
MRVRDSRTGKREGGRGIREKGSHAERERGERIGGVRKTGRKINS